MRRQIMSTQKQVIWDREAGSGVWIFCGTDPRRGSLTDLFFENGNMLARVSDTEVPEEEAQNNLEMFEREYLFYDAEAQ